MNRKLFLTMFVFFSILLVIFCSPVLYGNDQSTFLLKRDGKIDAQINNQPLNQTLRELATKFSIDLKGISVGSEAVILNLSDVPLEELLKKMMRGYNYVLVRPEKSDRLMLMVLSRADRTKYVDTPAPTASVSPPIPQPVPQLVPQAIPDTTPQPRQTQRLSIAPQRKDDPQPPFPSSGIGGSAGPSGSTYGTTAPTSGSTPSQAGSSSPPTPPSVGLDPNILPPGPPGIVAGGTPVEGSRGSSGAATTSGPETGPTGSQPDPRPPQIPF
jgi:hypothetical protein